MHSLAQAYDHLQAGQLGQAAASCEQILLRSPEHPRALLLMGLVHQRRGRPQAALALVTRAQRQDPDNRDLFYAAGSLLLQLDRPNEAIEAFSGSLRLDPDHASTHGALGNARERLGQFERAVEHHRRAVVLAPRSAAVYADLASTFAAWGRLDSAISSLRQAVKLEPKNAEIHYNLGTTLRQAQRPAEAAQSLRQAVGLDPQHARAMMNLGVVLKSLGQLGAARRLLRRAADLRPRSPEIHWNRALTLLLAGEYRRGFAAYEWRRQVQEIAIRAFPTLLDWDGRPRPGRTLLVHAEQGLGDTLQFVRFVGQARQRVGRLLLLCQPPLRRLLEHAALDGVDALLTDEEALSTQAPHLQLPLLSLPFVLGLGRDDLSGPVPYLRAEHALVERWRRRLTEAAPRGLRVGICWQGNPTYGADQGRSIPLRHFLCLDSLGAAGVTLFSLQKKHGLEQLPPRGVINLGPELDEQTGAFVDTAAVMRGLDLVITSDTATAHLAGALGVPTWLLLAAVPDWRWGLEGQACPWYPGMRLFRQDRPGDWAGVFARVEAALRAEIAGSGGASR
jgi:Flp pilus assembly protein TadD